MIFSFNRTGEQRGKHITLKVFPLFFFLLLFSISFTSAGFGYNNPSLPSLTPITTTGSTYINSSNVTNTYNNITQNITNNITYTADMTNVAFTNRSENWTTNNVSASWFNGFLNWSWIQNIPTNLWCALTGCQLTGNLNISKAEPEIMLNNTNDKEFSRWKRTGTNNGVKLTNRVIQPAVDTLDVTVLIVAGGGSGAQNSGGAGGAGGLIYKNKTIALDTYAVVVGSGGTNSVTQPAQQGENSSFAGEVAVGGGGGGSGGVGGNGGSGGGAGYYAPPDDVGGNGTAGQGNNGGKGLTAPYYNTGGGGGAGAVGGDASTLGSGNGGDGLQININGTLTWYAGGGGGGNYVVSGGRIGGKGGGGNGSIYNSGCGLVTDGIDGLGGGGGGDGCNGNGGDGGDGVVVIRFLKTLGNATGGTITYDGDYQIHTFTTDGTFEITELAGDTTEEMDMISCEDGVLAGEKGICKYGDSAGRTILQGSNITAIGNLSASNFLGYLNWSWLQNIPSFLSAINQNLNTTSTPTFGGLQVNGNANITGNATINLIYGEAYNKTDAGFETIDLVNPDTYVQATKLIVGSNNGFSISGGNLTASTNGLYNVKVSASINAGGNSEYGIKVFLNETGQNNCYAHFHLSSGDTISSSIDCLININSTNNKLSVRFDDHSNPVNDITLEALNINAIRVGN